MFFFSFKGTSSTSSLISSSSSYDLNQSDRVYSPMPTTPRPHQLSQAPNLMRQSSVFSLPISKSLIQIGQSLIQEKLSNPNQDQATLNQQILNIERLNNLLNSNQLNFYQAGSQQLNNTWWTLLKGLIMLNYCFFPVFFLLLIWTLYYVTWIWNYRLIIYFI